MKFKLLRASKIEAGIMIFAFTMFFLSALPTTAKASSIGDYFGGIVGYSQICSCSGMVLLYIYDYATQSLTQTMYIPGTSKLDAYYNVWSSGQYTIGGVYWSTMVCEIYTGEECDTAGYAYSIIDATRGIGTSEY